MTTESNAETTTTTEEAIELDINKLIDKPYSEMTEEEIAFVVEWKAAIKARDAAYQEKIQAINDGMQEQLEALKQQLADDTAKQEALLTASQQRLVAAMAGDDQ